MPEEEYHLWFSQKQLEYLTEIKDILTVPPSHTFAKINGEIVEYTLASKTENHNTKWNDIKYLGKGVYHHSEPI